MPILKFSFLLVTLICSTSNATFLQAPHTIEPNLYSYSFQDPVNFRDENGLWAIQVGYGYSGFLISLGAAISFGVAVSYGNGKFEANVYTSPQTSAGIGMSFGRGLQASVTPGAQCLNDLEGTSYGAGFDSPIGGVSVSNGSVGKTYTLAGPSLGLSVFGFSNGTQIGSPIKTVPRK